MYITLQFTYKKFAQKTESCEIINFFFLRIQIGFSIPILSFHCEGCIYETMHMFQFRSECCTKYSNRMKWKLNTFSNFWYSTVEKIYYSSRSRTQKPTDSHAIHTNFIPPMLLYSGSHVFIYLVHAYYYGKTVEFPIHLYFPHQWVPSWVLIWFDA